LKGKEFYYLEVERMRSIQGELGSSTTVRYGEVERALNHGSPSDFVYSKDFILGVKRRWNS
jgi:hypothetical protein